MYRAIIVGSRHDLTPSPLPNSSTERGHHPFSGAASGARDIRVAPESPHTQSLEPTARGVLAPAPGLASLSLHAGSR